MSELNTLDKNFTEKRVDNDSIFIKVLNNEIVMSIVGEFNKNIKELENQTNTKIFFRGNSFTIKGKNGNQNKASEAIKFLINKFLLTGSIEKDDIILSVKKDKKINTKSNVHSLDQLIKTPRQSVIGRSKKQVEYIKALKENDIIMALGPAGTGKSFLAVSVAITLNGKKVDRVILSRPAVEAGEKLGFLPGDMKEKVDPYLRPLYDALYDLFGLKKFKKKLKQVRLSCSPSIHGGRTLKNSFAILDEAQNATLTQIKMFLTRIGENSKLVVNGDPSQIDLINKNNSGLIKSKRNFKKN